MVAFTKPLLLGNSGVSTVSKWRHPLFPAEHSQGPSTRGKAPESNPGHLYCLHLHHAVPPISLPSDPLRRGTRCTFPSHLKRPRAIRGAREEKVHGIAQRLQVARPSHFPFLKNRLCKADPKDEQRKIGTDLFRRRFQPR